MAVLFFVREQDGYFLCIFITRAITPVSMATKAIKSLHVTYIRTTPFRKTRNGIESRLFGRLGKHILLSRWPAPGGALYAKRVPSYEDTLLHWITRWAAYPSSQVLQNKEECREPFRPLRSNLLYLHYIENILKCQIFLKRPFSNPCCNFPAVIVCRVATNK